MKNLITFAKSKNVAFASTYSNLKQLFTKKQLRYTEKKRKYVFYIRWILCSEWNDNDYDNDKGIETFNTLHICFSYNYKKMHLSVTYWSWRIVTVYVLRERWTTYTYHELICQQASA